VVRVAVLFSIPRLFHVQPRFDNVAYRYGRLLSPDYYSARRGAGNGPVFWNGQYESELGVRAQFGNFSRRNDEATLAYTRRALSTFFSGSRKIFALTCLLTWTSDGTRPLTACALVVAHCGVCFMKNAVISECTLIRCRSGQVSGAVLSTRFILFCFRRGRWRMMHTAEIYCEETLDALVITGTHNVQYYRVNLLSTRDRKRVRRRVVVLISCRRPRAIRIHTRSAVLSCRVKKDRCTTEQRVCWRLNTRFMNAPTATTTTRLVRTSANIKSPGRANDIT